MEQLNITEEGAEIVDEEGRTLARGQLAPNVGVEGDPVGGLVHVQLMFIGTRAAAPKTRKK